MQCNLRGGARKPSHFFFHSILGPQKHDKNTDFGLHFLLCWRHKPCYFHTGGWPPQFYRSIGPLSIGFFLNQMHLVGVVPIESRHSTGLSGFIFATVSVALTVFLFSPSSLLCSLFSWSPGISANFQAFCIFPPPGLQFLRCWWHKPCYFHTRGWPLPIL